RVPLQSLTVMLVRFTFPVLQTLTPSVVLTTRFPPLAFRQELHFFARVSPGVIGGGQLPVVGSPQSLVAVTFCVVPDEEDEPDAVTEFLSPDRSFAVVAKLPV